MSSDMIWTGITVLLLTAPTPAPAPALAPAHTSFPVTDIIIVSGLSVGLKFIHILYYGSCFFKFFSDIFCKRLRYPH